MVYGKNKINVTSFDFDSGRWGKQRPNPNVTRALSIRRVPFKEYYNKESDYSKSWFGQRIHQVLFYGE